MDLLGPSINALVQTSSTFGGAFVGQLKHELMQSKTYLDVSKLLTRGNKSNVTMMVGVGGEQLGNLASTYNTSSSLKS